MAEGAWEQYVLELYETNPELVAKIHWLLGGPRELVLGNGEVAIASAVNNTRAAILLRPCPAGVPGENVPLDVMDPKNVQPSLADTILWFVDSTAIDRFIDNLEKLKLHVAAD